MNPAAGCTLHARLRWRRMLRFHAALIDASVLGSVRTVPTSSRQKNDGYAFIPRGASASEHRCHGSAEPPHDRIRRPWPAFRLGPVRLTRSAPLLGTLGRGIESLPPSFASRSSAPFGQLRFEPNECVGVKSTLALRQREAALHTSSGQPSHIAGQARAGPLRQCRAVATFRLLIWVRSSV
jgi:hypothetical protein